MMPRWKKLGLLYENPGLHPKLATHAANPTAVHLNGDIFRIFFCGRDDQNRSSVGGVDINILSGSVVREYDTPFATHGPPGSYFHAGISIGNCHEWHGERFIFFMGWQIPEGEHWFGELGLLKLHEDMTLSVVDPHTPLMGLDDTDPVSLSYPWTMADGNGGLRMIYGSTVTWDTGRGEMLHTLNQAVSDDGLTWRRLGTGVPFHLNHQQAFSRPAVLETPEGFHLWFSFRGTPATPYRIGHALSRDGTAWQLSHDYRGITVSDSGWDSEMIEYPNVFTHKGRCYMLYNGNGYGRTGFGLAVL